MDQLGFAISFDTAIPRGERIPYMEMMRDNAKGCDVSTANDVNSGISYFHCAKSSTS